MTFVGLIALYPTDEGHVLIQNWFLSYLAMDSSVEFTLIHRDPEWWDLIPIILSYEGRRHGNGGPIIRRPEKKQRSFQGPIDLTYHR